MIKNPVINNAIKGLQSPNHNDYFVRKDAIVNNPSCKFLYIIVNPANSKHVINYASNQIKANQNYGFVEI